MDDRQRFEQYVEKVNALLRSEDFYANFRRRLRASRPEFKLSRKDRKKHFELDWIEMIESCVVNLDNIVRNPRKFIVIEEDIVDISLARAISTESIKHLAQHTNMIASVDKEGNVTPNKILNTTKEESFEVYENRFIYTLLKNLSNFVSRRLDAIKMSYVNDHILELTAKGNFFMGKTRVFCNFEVVGSLPTDPAKPAEQSRDVEILQRVTKLQRVISDFLSSPFAKQMVNSAPVRPPITRTNVILKNPDFKKALVLWQFIESYTKMGFQVENDVKKMPVDDKVDTMMSDMMCLSNMIMEGLIHGEAQDMAFFDEANMTEEDKEKEQVEKAETQEEQPAEEKQPEETPPVQEEVAESVPDEQEIEGEEKEKEPDEGDESGEDDDLPNDFGIAEIRNMFQQTDKKVSKAELRRINLAIDRVLLAERTAAAKRKTDVAEIESRQQGVERDRLRKQLEKEKETVERVLARKEKLEEKQRRAEERQRALAEQRLKEIEQKLESTPESGEVYEQLEEVETDQVTPMLATEMTKIEDKDVNAPIAAHPQREQESEQAPTEQTQQAEQTEQAGEITEQAEQAEQGGEKAEQTGQAEQGGAGAEQAEKPAGSKPEGGDQDAPLVPKKGKKPVKSEAEPESGEKAQGTLDPNVKSGDDDKILVPDPSDLPEQPDEEPTLAAPKKRAAAPTAPEEKTLAPKVPKPPRRGR